MKRAVLDTNTIVSALLFSGTASRLVPVWQSRRIILLVFRPIVEEYLRVLAYPKFRLRPAEVRALVEEELLPFTEVVRGHKRLPRILRDPDDEKFLACAVGGRAGYLVSGDHDLLELRSHGGVRILTVGDFLEHLEA